MRRSQLNLSSKPFVNQRPVGRLAWAFWILGALLLVANVQAYRGFFFGSDEKEAEIARLDEVIRAHEGEISRLKKSLTEMDLYQQNEQVAFLNEKIAQRTFSWSQLFDHLEEVLPDDVRISSLSPQITRLGRQGQPQEESERIGDRVAMNVVGVAKSVEAELEFVDSFFNHASFQRPRLRNDSQDGRESRFSLSVIYLPVLDTSAEDVGLLASLPDAGGDPAQPMGFGRGGDAVGRASPADRQASLTPGSGAARGLAGDRSAGSGSGSDTSRRGGRPPANAIGETVPGRPRGVSETRADQETGSGQARRGASTADRRAANSGRVTLPGAAVTPNRPNRGNARRPATARGGSLRPGRSGGAATRPGSRATPPSAGGETNAPGEVDPDDFVPTNRQPSASAALEPQ